MNARTALTAGAAVVVVLVAGCSSDDTTPPVPSVSSNAAPIPALTTSSGATSSSPTPEASAEAMPTGVGGQPRGLPTTTVDTTSADAVATAFVETTYAYDTATDVSEFDAQVRSATYATTAFAAELTTPLARNGSLVFTTLASHQGFTTAALVPNLDDGQPPDELRSAARSYSVTVTGQGSDGWSEQVDATTVYVFLTRDGASAPWQVSSVSFGLGQ